MGKRSSSLLALAVLGLAGCQSSEAPSGSVPQAQQNPPSPEPTPTAPPVFPPQPFTTALIQSVSFAQSAAGLLSAEERGLLEAELVECGIGGFVQPGCVRSSFRYAQRELDAYAGPNGRIRGKVARLGNGRALYLVSIDQEETGSRELRIYAANAATSASLDDLDELAQKRITALPHDERIARLAEALEAEPVAGVQLWQFADQAAFAAAYGAQAPARAFYHWTLVALTQGFGAAPVVKAFSEHFGARFSGATEEYRAPYVELGLRAAEAWKAGAPVAQAFRAQFSSPAAASLRGELAISILTLEPVASASTEHLAAARSYLFGTPTEMWELRGVRLFTQFGAVFGKSAELARFGESASVGVREEVARALARYSDGLANQWILRLTADPYSIVRAAALRTIDGRDYDFGGFDVSPFINSDDSSSRSGLAQGLRHARGQGVNVALLRLSADAYSSVRDAALSSIDGRELTVGGFPVLDLIRESDSSSRAGLARALKHAREPVACEALLKLNADAYSSVREAAIESIAGRVCDLGASDVAQFIDADDSSSRAGLARALRHAAGRGAFEALLRLNADSYSSVREAAYASIRGRDFDYGAFDVLALVNTGDSTSRTGLARALEFAQGASANEALLRLNADTYSSVRDAALESIEGNPFDAGAIQVSQYIYSGDSTSRTGLARALRYVTGKKSIDALIILVSDEYSSVREAARASLKAHGWGG
jgi:hypothetical protein